MRFRTTTSTLAVLGVSLLLGLAACGKKEESKAAKDNKSSQVAKTTRRIALPKGDPVRGKDLYMKNCLACHGPDAKGIKGLGKDLTTSEFVATRTDEQLLEYVKKGRTPDDPLNTTGVAMPPKGGNPALRDSEIIHIIAYIRTINKAAKK